MHINNWVHASDLMKMVKSANSISTLSSEEGLPDNHVITIRERELTVDFPELIQNNIKTDTVTLELDAEWDGIQPVIIFGPNADGTIAVEYTGEPVHIPGAVMQYVGGLDCSVMGLDDSGEVRLVTKAAPNTFEVVESGEYIGQISEDDVSLLGQILSAIKDAETATSDASSAAEDATAAADSANTAAAKATNAANSANTAATKATAAANSANTASERAENAYDVLTPIIAEIGVNGNQPRATTNPNYIVTASDAYAAKPLEICIKGETRQNLWVNPSGTVNGITAKVNADGSVTLSGTATGSINLHSHASYNLRPGSTYYMTCSPNPNGFNLGVTQYVNGATKNTKPMPTGGGEITIDSDVTHVTCVIYNIVSGQTVSDTYRIMLNEGSEPEPWCPPGLNSVDELSIVTAGKNLFNAASGDSINVGADGAITLENDFTWALFGDQPINIPKGTKITLSKSVALGGTCGPGVWLSYNYTNQAEITAYGSTNKNTYTTTRDYNRIRCFINGGGVTANTPFYVQLELGSTATDYEPFNIITTPIDLDGNTLCSLPDGTHDELTIDATGAVTLVKRTNMVKVIADDLSVDTPNYARFLLNGEPRYSGGVSFSRSDQMNSLSFVGNADAELPLGRRAIGVYDIKSMPASEFRIGVPPSSEDIDSQLAKCKAWLGSTGVTVIYAIKEPQTVSLPPVTLPTLPSPNITVYHDSDVPSDITVEYVQDINIVLDNLNAKIAALNIAQSISS